MKTAKILLGQKAMNETETGWQSQFSPDARKLLQCAQINCNANSLLYFTTPNKQVRKHGV